MPKASTRGKRLTVYTPRHFANQDLDEIHALIESNPLATLVTQNDGRLDATHVPCVLDREEGDRGRLRFHLARANPACAALRPDREALLIFTGADCYISPDWYRSDGLVPTWNYAAVHAYGRASTMTDEALCRLLDDLSDREEARLPKAPWTTGKLAPAAYAKLRQAIVGFALPIAELQGKWKMSQNRTAEDRDGVVEALERLGGESRGAVAAQMRSRNRAR